jgi:tripartite-type tricarboxylate transporter receptor subunit TctC
MTPGEIAVLAAIAFLGALIFGITGFGAALVTIPLATHLVPLKFALALFALADLGNALRIGFENPKNAVRAEWRRLVPAILVGTALGATLLVNLPRAAAMLALGVFVIGFSLYSLTRRETRAPLSVRWGPVAGLAGGITSTLFGAGGPPYVMYLSRRGLTKEQFRATLGLSTLTGISLRVAAFLITGLLLDPAVWLAAAVVVPVSLIGISVARRIFLRVSRDALLRAVAALLLLSGGSLIWRASHAQDYPNKVVRFIVPYAPGGSSDVLARTLGQKLGGQLGQTFIIDNRPGAGSMIGTDAAAKAPADGYTIILSDMPHVINPSIYARVPYDPVEDFAPITLIGVSPMFLFANPSFEATSVNALVALARAQPGKIAIASGGTGATTHLIAELFQSNAGIRLTHVPYKGAGPAISDVVAGQVPVTFTSMATAAPHVKSGRLRVLGVTSARRLPALPEVPTFEESGVHGMTLEHWWGVMAPARTPRPIIDRLHVEIVRAVTSLEVRERFAGLAVEPRTNTPEQFHALLVSDMGRWAKVVRDAGIKPE